LINTIKVAANLDIANRERPQDGHFELYENMEQGQEEGAPVREEKTAYDEIAEKFKSLNKKAPAKVVPEQRKQRVLDIRLSVFPSVNGEIVVARLLNRLDALMTLNQLGMDEHALERVESIISKDYGMILITGPVGAGKTTTLYSLMQELKSDVKNIMTLEDPVEFHLEWLRQSELKPERGFDFDSALRSILRQDPDVLMIGEIRDRVAAENAISISLVGRIVGTTIHSNNTVGTIARLIDMNIERAMIAYAINGVISQRLVRRSCKSCVAPYTPADNVITHFGLADSGWVFMKGAGCDKCEHTGFFGRVGIFEVFQFDDTLRSMIVQNSPMKDLENHMVQSGMKSLREDALEKVRLGMTTLEEISRVVS
jgi:type II secretory ATPase GspE/PulE/Tfp pilus assembly ATPase PilB-like protein